MQQRRRQQERRWRRRGRRHRTARAAHVRAGADATDDSDASVVPAMRARLPVTYAVGADANSPSVGGSGAGSAESFGVAAAMTSSGASHCLRKETEIEQRRDVSASCGQRSSRCRAPLASPALAARSPLASARRLLPTGMPRTKCLPGHCA